MIRIYIFPANTQHWINENYYKMRAIPCRFRADLKSINQKKKKKALDSSSIKELSSSVAVQPTRKALDVGLKPISNVHGLHFSMLVA